MRLEEKVVLDWPFEFWDNKERCRIRQKMEVLNDVVSDVYVLSKVVEVEGQESCKHRRVDNDTVPNPAGAIPNPVGTEEVVFPNIDEENEVHIVDPIRSSRVTGMSGITDCLDHELHLTLISTEVWERYLEQSEKMKRELKCSSQEDNRWKLRTSDFNGNGVIKIFCIEC